MTTAKTKSCHDGKKYLQDAFRLQQQLLCTKLALSSQTITHSGVMGEVSEDYFIEILRQYLPHRYAVDTGIVLDSSGATSDQIDVIIFDNQYTPTLLDQQDHRFIPAEAVYAVFEVKQEINKDTIGYAGDKVESVRKLTRTTVPIVHAGGAYPAKPPFAIVGGIIAGKIDWASGFSGETFPSILKAMHGLRKIDCGLAVSGSVFDTFDGRLAVGPEEQALAFFLFRLLQKLQSLGTVPAIDWNAYAAALGKNGSKERSVKRSSHKIVVAY